jgi:UDPglucose 6-dehydrogenase
VPTPQGADGAADLSCLDAAVREIAPALDARALVVTKSTVPIGTARRIQQMLDEAGASGVRVASNPEFLREGSAVRDFLRPDRVVLGVDDPSSAVAVTDLYRGIHAPTLVTDLASAELIKYAANGYLATRISFINAMSALCEAAGADVHDVALGIGYDERIGPLYLKPGPGYGGSCLPKDVSALVFTAQELGVDLPPLRAAEEVNRAQRAWVLSKIVGALDGVLEGATVAVWGLTFKANTDDLRDSPAVEIVEALFEQGASVRAYDPVAGAAGARLLPGAEVVADAYEACEGADVLAVLTEWDEFRWADFSRVGEVMRGAQIVDGRNLLDASRMRQQGFVYQGVGR